MTKDLLTMKDLTARYNKTRVTIEVWVNTGLFPLPIVIGGSNFWRREDVLAFEAAKTPGRKEKKAERETVTILDGAPEATKIARSVAKTGSLPERCRTDWRTPFRHCEKRLPPRELQALFDLDECADWLDVADAIGRKLNSRPPVPAYAGWSEGAPEAVKRAKRAEAALAETRKARRA